MNKSLFILVIGLLMAGTAYAQLLDDTIAQPNHVMGKMINESGEVTNTYEADFGYNSENMLTSFDHPAFNLRSQLFYTNHYLTFVHTIYSYLEERYDVSQEFVYENELLQIERLIEIEYTYDNRDYVYTYYTYNESGRLEQKEDSVGFGLRHRWCYEYENDGKSVIVTYLSKFNGYYHLETVSTYHYDDDYMLQEVLVEDYCDHANNHHETEPVEITKSTYSYTEEGKVSTEIGQTLIDSIWVNTKIHNNIYDESGAIAEQQDGAWSDELGDWNITEKVIHEFSRTNMTYMVSFYKKSGDSWVRDIFRKQTLFFEPELQWQQKEMLNFFSVNQLEFSMTYTDFPPYLSVDEGQSQEINVYPNPGKEELKIVAPIENAVIRFYDLQGRKVAVLPFDFTTTINTNEWVSGTYIWEIWHNTQKEARGKWIKE